MQRVKEDVRAVVTLVPTADGGRAGPTPVARHACRFAIAGREHDCWLFFGEGNRMAPGETLQVGIKFLNRSAALEGVSAGDTFELFEIRRIGLGRIEAICPP